MSHTLHSTDRSTWSQLVTWLLLGFVCYALPWSAFASDGNASNTVLRLQGSNTVGAKLGPALVAGLFAELGLHNIRIEKSAVDNEQLVLGKSANGQEVQAVIAAHGSGTGFVGLQQNTADIAASSRPIKAAELQTLAPLGDMRSMAAEQVIAIDGLAIILHRNNSVSALTTAQLAAVFAGEISTWEQLGGSGGAIHLYARDDNSGTYDTFKELVLAPQGKTLASQAKRYESSDELSDNVSRDPAAIGFIGLPYVRQSKAVAIADGESLPMLPTTSLIATEDYPLSRRLFLYIPPNTENSWSQALAEFSHSAKGQALVAKAGFIPQTVEAIQVQANAQMPSHYQQLSKEAQRLSVNFRFKDKSANLDNKSQRDLERVMAYIQAQDKLYKKVVLVGFGDPKADPQRAELLSRLRAMTVRRELAKNGVVLREITGFGELLPVAANSVDEGRLKNRRVEVWVY